MKPPVNENTIAPAEHPIKPLGRFWSRPDGKSWAGYVDFGVLGRIKVQLVPNSKRRPGKMDSDLILLVRVEDTILQQLFRFVREKNGDTECSGSTS